MAPGLFLGAQMTVRWRKSLSRPTRVLCQNSRFVGTCPLASLVSQRRRLPPSGTRPCGAAHVGCLLHGGDGWRARGGGAGLTRWTPSIAEAILVPSMREAIFWNATSRARWGEPCLGLTSMLTGEKPQSPVCPDAPPGCILRRAGCRHRLPAPSPRAGSAGRSRR